MTKNNRLIHGLYGHNVETVDPFSFQFNGPKKALFYMAIKLIPPIPNSELDKLTSPNAVVMREIYYWYLENERQEWRREIYTRVIPFLILLTAREGDQNHAETFESMLYKLCEAYEAGNLEFDLTTIHPPNWWNDEWKGRDWITVKYKGNRTTNTVIEKMEV